MGTKLHPSVEKYDCSNVRFKSLCSEINVKLNMNSYLQVMINGNYFDQVFNGQQWYIRLSLIP